MANTTHHRGLVPICFDCGRFRDVTPDVGFTCEAFPDRAIPVEILASCVDHRKPYEGDRGLQYQAKRLATQAIDCLPMRGAGPVSQRLPADISWIPRSLALDAWEEHLHPRKPTGQFAKKGEVYGPIHKTLETHGFKQHPDSPHAIYTHPTGHQVAVKGTPTQPKGFYWGHYKGWQKAGEKHTGGGAKELGKYLEGLKLSSETITEPAKSTEPEPPTKSEKVEASPATPKNAAPTKATVPPSYGEHLTKLGWQHVVTSPESGNQLFDHPNGGTILMKPAKSGQGAPNWEFTPSPKVGWAQKGKGFTSFQKAIKASVQQSAEQTAAVQPPKGIESILPGHEQTKWKGGAAERWSNFNHNAFETESLVVGTAAGINAGQWQIWTKKGGVVASGSGQQSLNQAFEKLHPRGPGGKFTAKPEEAAAPVEMGAAAVGKTLSLDNLKQVGPQQGSNPGGTYEDSAGKQYYVKFMQTSDHAKNEMLAAALFRAAGGDTFDYHAVTKPAALGLATDIVPLDKNNVNQLSPEERKKAQSDFALHAWLANWDAVGLTGDNIGVSSIGTVLPLDFGGSLLYRAKGTPKGAAFGDIATEWTTLRSIGKNPTSAALYGSMTPAELKASAARLEQIDDAAIDELVEKFAPGLPAEKAELATKLKARKASIAGFAATEGKPPPPPPPPEMKPISAAAAKPKVSPEEIEGHLSSKNYNGAYYALETHAPKINDIQSDALSSYKGSGYASMNDCMRTQDNCKDQKVKRLQAWLDQASTPAPLTVWRRVKGAFSQAMFSIGTVGMRWQERGFVSTALDPGPMAGWGDLTMEIKAPAGMPGTTVHNIGESEVLFNRGVHLKIIAFDRGKKHMICEMDNGNED